MSEPIESIEKEAELCRKAFAGVEMGAWVSHCHHEDWLERLTERLTERPAESRIAYILAFKPPAEKAARLRLFRPFDVTKADEAWTKVEAVVRECRERYYASGESGRGELGIMWERAEEDLQKAAESLAMLKVHAEVCGCPWSPRAPKKDIFGESH